MNELRQVKNRIKKLLDKKALIDEELEPLFMREKELENLEIIAICRSHEIGLEELKERLGFGRKQRRNDAKAEKNYRNMEDEKNEIFEE